RDVRIAITTKIGELAKAVAAKSVRVLRLTKIQVRRFRRLLLKRVRRARVAALVRLFQTRQRTERVRRRILTHVYRWSATIVSVLILLLFVTLAQDTGNLKVSEVHLTCAQVVGAALALILSLSIIPAQRAAEAFSPAVLKLYAKDYWLLGA